MTNGAQHSAGKDTDKAGPSLERAERDLIALGIILAAIILFVGTGSTVLTGIVRKWVYGIGNPDTLLANALILNIALIIFGWRRYVELNREIAERRKAELTAQRLAHTDALTGCLNRRSLDASLAALIDSADTSGNEVVMMMIDLDKFKNSNDLHGHHVGDAVLIETAQRIQSLMPERSLMARLGGDEFICALVFAPASEAAVERLAVQLNDALARPIECKGVRAEVTASIGIASGAKGVVNPAGQLAQDLLHRSDVAMYQAKRRGRNRFCWFEPSMETELRFRSELEAAIREGLPRGEFVPYYEKQVDLETGEITGFEMLARWVSARRGVISPEIFIPVAEEIGMIAELSETLIGLALRDAKAWDPRLTLSVNISPLQLRDPWFAQRFLKMLVEANFPPNRLEIEITETCLHENIGVVRSLITSLKNQGIRISLDDFGTGYSSLAQLRTLPFDRIKIDRSFVSTLNSNADSSSIIEAISSLGRGMALPITAEGIESAEVLVALRKFGSFKGQGYLYGKPATGEEVLRELAEHQLLSQQSPADQYRLPEEPESPAAMNG